MATIISDAELDRKIQQVLEQIQNAGERFIVEHQGTPIAAIVSVEDLQRIDLVPEQAPLTKTQRLAALAEATAFSDQILARRNGEPLPDSVELIRELREERDRELEEAVRGC